MKKKKKSEVPTKEKKDIKLKDDPKPKSEKLTTPQKATINVNRETTGTQSKQVISYPESTKKESDVSLSSDPSHSPSANPSCSESGAKPLDPNEIMKTLTQRMPSPRISRSTRTTSLPRAPSPPIQEVIDLLNRSNNNSNSNEDQTN